MTQYCKADVYNFAIGGAQAALNPTESAIDGLKGTNVTGVAMAEAITGKIPIEFLEIYPYVYDLFAVCDFNDIDVFVIEYGINDYLARIPLTNYMTNLRYESSYRSALELILNMLIEKFPDAKFVVCSPGYAQFFDNDAFVGDGNTLNNGYGRLIEYVDSCNNVVTSSYKPDVVGLMNPYYDLGVTVLNAKENLLDGIHMNRNGREQYAQMLARIVIRMEGYSIDPGINPMDVDWVATK